MTGRRARAVRRRKGQLAWERSRPFTDVRLTARVRDGQLTDMKFEIRPLFNHTIDRTIPEWLKEQLVMNLRAFVASEPASEGKKVGTVAIVYIHDLDPISA